MDSREIINNAAGVYFTDTELIELLQVIVSDSKTMIPKIIEELNTVDSLQEYLDPFTVSGFKDKSVKECYEDYYTWCELNYLPVKSKKVFTQAVIERFNLDVKTTTIDGKNARVYRAV